MITHLPSDRCVIPVYVINIPTWFTKNTVSSYEPPQNKIISYTVIYCFVLVCGVRVVNNVLLGKVLFNTVEYIYMYIHMQLLCNAVT